jgi:hypothetical protein
VSANWAGYTASGTTFSNVSGSWVQPNTNCSSTSGAAAFWVGLGGADQQSPALEQVGTETNCDGTGAAQTFAWYELVPSAPVRLDMTIQPGDHVSASVSVSGSDVTVAITDQTTGASTSKQLTMSNPDASSAEWIAEAPSQCNGDLSQCQPVALPDFGTVTFSNASATAGGHTGAISDTNWQAQPLQLSGSTGGGQVYGGGGFFGGGAATTGTQQSGGDAAPTTLADNGSAFSVSWQGGASSTAGSQPGVDVTPGYGYGDGGYSGGYGYGGDGYGSGYGYGYPGDSTY